ncbi:hypothetical protein [Nonlabens sp. Asnod3-H03]|uniref:hypothetical protein n=1 Tax=Nonlabens sp. Asnod3-H03 TaxID=3160580 RepID=UPI00386520E4
MEKESNISRTVINGKGEIVFFGLQHFLDDIANGDCCFICGAKSDSKEFNDEHIIPDWILRKYNLHNEYVTLPNGTKFKYSQYKVPCCKECNTELGKTYEEPISELLGKSYSEIVEEIKNNPKTVHFLFRWLSLIFLKTHLKDKTLLTERDTRIDSGFLSDDYYWEDIHHIHCIARSHYTKAKIDSTVYGTIFILQAMPINRFGGFDFIDNQAGKAIMLQLGEFAIVSVLNDSCAGYTIFKEQIKKISGPLSTFQLREIVAHLNFINLSLKERPIYRSFINYFGEYHIKSTVPETLYLLDKEERFVSPGQFLKYYVEPMIGDVENREQILQELEEGKRNFLFDENGEFLKYDI